jgi:dihydrofolate reductase
VIGAGPDIPWRIPGEQARFKRLTMGHPLVMGRVTHDSIGRPLPGRTTLVVSRDPGYAPAGVEVFADLDAALDRAHQLDDRLVFVAGGGQVYRAAWPRLDAIELTEVDQEPAGDVLFPVVDPAQWRETAREEHDGFRYRRLVRRDRPRR